MIDKEMNTTEMLESGHQKIQWAIDNMPILGELESEFERMKYFAGKRIAVSVHVEAKTARLALLLAKGGADVYLTGCNPLSTQDDVALALAERGITVHCQYGASPSVYRRHLELTLESMPHLMIDDGGDLAEIIHTTGDLYTKNLLGSCEETTTGVHRLRIFEKEKKLRYPAIAVNDARCKCLFDNRYGTGQSVITAIMETTNLLIAGKTFVVAGYGMCGKGVAMRAKNMGANVIITEIDPIKALEALMDGMNVMTMDEASALGDFFVTVTGCKDVITSKHYVNMKNGAILANAGHFDVEVNIKNLKDESISDETRRKNIQGYYLKNNHCINLLAKGRLVNLASGNGHPAEIMDMSFAIQALCTLYLLNNAKDFEKKVYGVPEEIDRRVAEMLLRSKGIQIDALTDEQCEYMDHWSI
ncbi:MAG: adenosylhomocysteinase [Saccharofermentanales bacterium]